ncbi:GGDEF domain-containing protein [Amphibiibacter pelophylacis]|uniref:Diguanylate cyclase n=1 Tax=Amphibiibacter pelophylacis TaxID=1799477 RepID=A0ACC6P2B2_9BURK
MKTPLEVLSVSEKGWVPDLSMSHYGPFVVEARADLPAVTDALRAQPPDVLLLHWNLTDAIAQLRRWNAQLLLADVPVLLVSTEPDPALLPHLVTLGVQDALSSREAGSYLLAKALRMAVERQTLLSDTRRSLSLDMATGLPNQKQLQEHMSHLLALRARDPAPMSLLVLQFQGLAPLEGSLGSVAASVLRRKVAVRLRSALRASDVVASLGPSQFAILLAVMDTPQDVAHVQAKLRTLLDQPYVVSGQSVSLPVDMVAVESVAQQNPGELIGQALLRMNPQAPVLTLAGTVAPSGNFSVMNGINMLQGCTSAND